MKDSARSNGRDEPVFRGDEVIELTEYGRAMWQAFLHGCKEIAGRDVDPDEIVIALKALKEELGTDEPDFEQASVMARFKEILRDET